MNTNPEHHTQLGDATIIRCSGGGFLGMGDVDLIVHQTSNTFMRVGVREGTTATARFKVEDLPALIHTLIARSGRTDLTLHQTEPPTTDDDTHVKVEVPVDADPARTVQALTKANLKGVV